MNMDYITRGKGAVLTGAGLFCQLLRETQVDGQRIQRSQFDGTEFGKLLDAAENGDTAGLYECIGRIEYLFLQGNRIFVHSGPTRAELLLGVRDFLRYFGLTVDNRTLQGYRRSVPRSAFPRG